MLGGVLVLFGLAFGFTPASTDGDCGSAFGGAPNSVYNSDGEAACTDARRSSRNIALVLLGLGGVVIVGAWVAAGARISGPGQRHGTTPPAQPQQGGEEAISQSEPPRP
jgi:hypothetical protein